MYQVIETDWKLFRKRIPEWQVRYMQRLCGEYAALLSSEDLPSNKFWELEKRIRLDKRAAGVCVEMRRSRMWINLLMLLDEKAIPARIWMASVRSCWML